MAARLGVLADAEAAALAGLPGAPADSDLVVALGMPDERPGTPWVMWTEDCVIAPNGDGLWRRAPWPVNDALFELDLPAEPAIAVAVEDAGRRAGLLDRIGGEAPAEGCERLTADVLERAGVVVMSASGERFPPLAFAVLAARRVLVLDRLPAAFGLLAGRDHVQAGTDAEALQAAVSAIRHPRSFGWMRELGALAAERHRASRVYARLATDLELEGVAR